jgi:CRISPR-associated endonuclease/helicase Cas3
LENAAEFCYEKFSQNGNLLVIVNTKSEALRIYRSLKSIEYNEETTVIHLSTNMCPQHRRNKINEIKKLLNEKKPIICVTTQLIEAGIDISFKCVIRFIAGMDNIAQAAGRCNRNGEINHICPVYVINIQNENLSGLSDIKDAQAVSRQIADSSQIEDYLSVDTMSQYYRMLFRKKERELSFNVTDTDNNLPTSIMNLLSLNSVRNIKGIDQYSAQAFKTAGALFNVIDNSTVDVIVPYSEGEDKDAKEILSKLNSDISPNETAELLRKAQKYTVGIYSSSYAKLCEMNALHMLKCGAIELRDGFYNNEYGLSSDEGRQETLIY